GEAICVRRAAIECGWPGCAIHGLCLWLSSAPGKDALVAIDTGVQAAGTFRTSPENTRAQRQTEKEVHMNGIPAVSINDRRIRRFRNPRRARYRFRCARPNKASISPWLRTFSISPPAVYPRGQLPRERRDSDAHCPGWPAAASAPRNESARPATLPLPAPLLLPSW